MWPLHQLFLVFVLFDFSVEALDDSSDSGSDFESTQKGKRWRVWSKAQHPVMCTVLSCVHLFLTDLFRLNQLNHCPIDPLFHFTVI